MPVRTTRSTSSSSSSLLLLLLVTLLGFTTDHLVRGDFAYFKNKFGDLLEIKNNANYQYTGVSAIRHPNPYGNSKNIYIGYTTGDPKKASVSGNVINLSELWYNKFTMEYWVNNLPVMIVDRISSSSLNKLYEKMHNTKIPFEACANLLHHNPGEYVSVLTSGNRQAHMLPENSKFNPRETDKVYMEAEGFVTVNGMLKPQGYGFILSKEDGSAVIGKFVGGVSEYHHKFQLNGKHEYYRRNLCSGSASEMTIMMLQSLTKIKDDSYAYYVDKPALCRHIMKLNTIAESNETSFGDTWQCSGSIHLGVLDGIGLAYNKRENKYIAGMWLLGHPTTPRIEVVGRSFNFIGVEDAKEFADDAKVVIQHVGNQYTFSGELLKLATKLCQRYANRAPEHKI